MITVELITPASMVVNTVALGEISETRLKM